MFRPSCAKRDSNERREDAKMRCEFTKTFFTCSLVLVAVGFAYCQNVYQDSESGVALSLPPGWTWTGPNRWADEKGAKSILLLKEAGTTHELRLWIQNLDPPETMTPADKMDRRLLKLPQRKIEQRTREGYQNYRLREGSCELHPINGRSALTWVADYTDRGQHMVEYWTIVRSENTHALLYGRVPAEQLDDFRTRVNPIIETLQIR